MWDDAESSHVPGTANTQLVETPRSGRRSQPSLLTGLVVRRAGRCRLAERQTMPSRRPRRYRYYVYSAIGHPRVCKLSRPQVGVAA